MDLFRKRHAVMCFLSNDTVSGALVPYAGSSARPDLFRLDVGYDPEEETLTDYPEARCLQLIRAAVGISDLSLQLKTVQAWEMAARVADRFQQGRVFLVGNAARVQPPTGALGGNTGIAEAQNLAWKLAAVQRSEAKQGLLATYDQERRSVADFTVEQVTLLSQQRQNEGSAGISVDTLIVNMGYRYNAGAIVQEDDENLSLVQSPDWWTGQPGTRAAYRARTPGQADLDAGPVRFPLRLADRSRGTELEGRCPQHKGHTPFPSGHLSDWQRCGESPRRQRRVLSLLWSHNHRGGHRAPRRFHRMEEPGRKGRC